jgi:hypothetical protein
MGSEHDEIVKILFELCQDYNYSQIHAYNISEECDPLPITLPRRGRSLTENYNPDIWAETKRRLIDIYEVWHSETESEAILDILYSALTKNVNYLHIVCTGDNITEDRAEDLVYLILGKLYKGGYRAIHPSWVYITGIPEEIKGNSKGIKRHLKKAFGF